MINVENLHGAYYTLRKYELYDKTQRGHNSTKVGHFLFTPTNDEILIQVITNESHWWTDAYPICSFNNFEFTFWKPGPWEAQLEDLIKQTEEINKQKLVELQQKEKDNQERAEKICSGDSKIVLSNYSAKPKIKGFFN